MQSPESLTPEKEVRAFSKATRITQSNSPDAGRVKWNPEGPGVAKIVKDENGRETTVPYAEYLAGEEDKTRRYDYDSDKVAEKAMAETDERIKEDLSTYAQTKTESPKGYTDMVAGEEVARINAMQGRAEDKRALESSPDRIQEEIDAKKAELEELERRKLEALQG